MGNEIERAEQHLVLINSVLDNATKTLQQVERIRQLELRVKEQVDQQLKEDVKIEKDATRDQIKEKFKWLDGCVAEEHKKVLDSGVEVLTNIIKSKSINGNVNPSKLGFKIPDEDKQHITDLIKANKIRIVRQSINRTNGVIKVLCKLENLTGKPLVVKVKPGDTFVSEGGRQQPGVNATTKTIDIDAYSTGEKIITCYCGNSSVSYPSSNPTIVKLCNLQWQMPDLTSLGIFDFTSDEKQELEKYNEIQGKIWSKFNELIRKASKIQNDIF